MKDKLVIVDTAQSLSDALLERLDILDMGEDIVLNLYSAELPEISVSNDVSIVDNRAERRSYGTGKKQRLKGLRP